MCRLFNRYAGVPPHVYLLRLKMNLAAHLLQESGRSVKDIAAELGFSDTYAFSKTFKRLLGMAPTFYRGT
jgi:AraC-like DNA-binding protein